MKRGLALALVLAAAIAATAGATSSAGVVVKTAYNASLKKTILVAGNGMTLYMFTADTSGMSLCTNDPQYHCSKAWPPLLTTGTPRAGAGAKASLLGTTKRSDGGVQVTYRHHPLYFFRGGQGLGKGDVKPGQVRGQAAVDLWWVLSPAGNPIKS